MSLVEIFYGTLGVGLLVWCLTGGADLGAGVWTWLARGPRRDAQREAVLHAIAPIWEANHVWLIFVIVVLFSAFSRAFAAIGVALHVPLALALLGLVFRGSAFVFHAYGLGGPRAQTTWTRFFVAGSLAAPSFLGIAAAAMSSGAIRLEGGVVVSPLTAGWTTPYALLVGLFAIALFATLAATYLAAETSGELSDDFRRRAIVSETILLPIAVAVFVRARIDAPDVFRFLVAHAASLGAAATVAALATIATLFVRRPTLARYAAAAQVATIVLGWGLAMEGDLLRSQLSARDAVAHPAVLRPIAIALAAGATILIPALAYLYRVFKARRDPV